MSLAHAFTPTWACIDAGNLASFPVLPGIECLTTGPDNDDAGLWAAWTLAERWTAERKEVRIATSPAAAWDMASRAIGVNKCCSSGMGWVQTARAFLAEMMQWLVGSYAVKLPPTALMPGPRQRTVGSNRCRAGTGSILPSICTRVELELADVLGVKKAHSLRRFRSGSGHVACLPLSLPEGSRHGTLSLLYFVITDVSVVFFLLSAMTVALYLIAYMFMYAAAIRLRYSKPTLARPFSMPGGIIGMWLVAGIGFAGVLFSFLVAFLPPDQLPVGSPKLYVTLVVAGTVVFCGIPLLMHGMRHARPAAHATA